MSHRNWWIGTTMVALAIVVHALVPRFDWRSCHGLPLASLDRWMGGAQADRRSSSLQDAGTLATASDGGAAIPDSAGTTSSVNTVDSHHGAPAPLGSWVRGIASACTIHQAVRPRLGAIGGRTARGSSGSLRIDNETGSDALAVLIADGDGTPRRAIFIRAGQVGLLAAVQPGRYRLRFQTASGNHRERRYCQSASEIDEAFDFSAVESDQQPAYAEYAVTLHPLAAGAARTHTPADSTARTASDIGTDWTAPARYGDAGADTKADGRVPTGEERLLRLPLQK